MCFTPTSAWSTTTTGTANTKAGVDLTTPLDHENTIPFTGTQLTTPKVTSSITKNVLKAIAAVTSKQSETNINRDYKKNTSYFHTHDNSSDTHQAQDHSEMSQVLSSSDSDSDQSDNEFAYMYAESVTEELKSDSDSSETM